MMLHHVNRMRWVYSMMRSWLLGWGLEIRDP